MSAPSDKMLDLLQQISVLKQLDEQARSGPESATGKEDSRKRRKRRQQISDEMKELATGARQPLSKEG